jgi:hypothetical protein
MVHAEDLAIEIAQPVVMPVILPSLVRRPRLGPSVS